MKGFKVTLPNGRAKHGTDNIVYAVGQEYKMVEDAIICRQGFHFCTKPADCFNYYDFNSSNLIFEVEALGNISKKNDESEDSKVATNHLVILRQVDWGEMLQLCNEGKNNTGLRNTGDSNTGDSNTGDRNTGNRNTGYSNTGYSNTGDRNTGYRNTGNSNTGNSNTGDRNTGNWNTGDSNTGNSNTGNRNTGYRNTGNSNTGDRNTGNWNTGVANKGNRHSGAFCTGNAEFKLFNIPTNMTYETFVDSEAYYLLCQVNTNLWINSSEMTDKQKAERPHHKVQGGIYVDIPFATSFQNKWETWNKNERKAFTDLPNFNADIFFEITGVKI